jgi:hypothetical protein
MAPRRKTFLPLALLAAAIACPGFASAQDRRAPPDPSPFAHAPCSVLDGQPCTPTVCSPLQDGPCQPEIEAPIGQDLHLTVLSVPPDRERARYRRPDHELDSIADLFAALRACWTPPAALRPDMQIAMRFSLRRDGALVAPPRLTFATPQAGGEVRTRYADAVSGSLAGCTPLPLTAGLGGAVAGRPIMVRYVDNRTVDQTKAPPANP